MKKNRPFIILLILVSWMMLQNFVPDATLQRGINSSSKTKDIRALTDEKVIIPYIKKEGKLPHYYLTKEEAKRLGWNPAKGNICEAIPNRAIGGNRFYNRERKLPKEKIYYEADVNVTCGYRKQDRVIYTKSGEVWLTKNHYKTFIKQ
ncbi:ribonuclease domain-containing protein [Bergeyella zoohelcum]|uniref:Ribonuclease n=1 Tax=Bergeyella zoohelcum TaxID=1015 RepID=A0A7Z9CGM9_9FLAO|nr:ribonuclease domain-containing protein [Bergeyella zoohelcum]VDH05345.1 S-layer-like domain-containing protein [Bergeyella zoohelcum]